jgi:hypothetical protein
MSINCNRAGRSISTCRVHCSTPKTIFLTIPDRFPVPLFENRPPWDRRGSCPPGRGSGGEEKEEAERVNTAAAACAADPPSMRQISAHGPNASFSNRYTRPDSGQQVSALQPGYFGAALFSRELLCDQHFQPT